MATVKEIIAALIALTSTGFNTLAAGTYVTTASYNCSTNNPVDLIVEVTAATTNTPAGNKQVVVFAQASYDGGTTWQSGPGTGTTTTDEQDLTYLGVLPINSSTNTHKKSFRVAQAYDGALPPMVRFVLKDDLGVALTSGSVATAEVSVTVA